MSELLAVNVTDEFVERVAARVAEMLADQTSAATGSPYLTVDEAATFLRSKPQRVYDLLSARKLTRHKDGSRTLVSRAELEAYVEARR